MLSKRFFSLLLAICLLLSLAACGGKNPQSGDSGNSDSGLFGGNEEIISVVHPDFQLTDGFIEPVERLTEVPAGYIPITTASEFCKIHLNPAENYILMADIDMSGMDYTAIVDFSGTFEGNGYTVSNAPSGLFLSISGGTVQNLGVYSHVTNSLSGIATNMNSGATMYNCWFDGSISSNPDGTYTKLAGLVRYASNAKIISCYNAADIFSGNIAGGVVGDISLAVTVKNCFNTGTITVDTSSAYCSDGIAGGILGQFDMSTSDGGASNVTNCRNSGTVTGVIAAGIVGNVYIADPSNLYICRCFNEADIMGEASAYLAVSRTGGITNVMNIEEGYVYIQDCYNTGNYASSGIEGGECLQRAWDLLSEDLDHVVIERCFTTAWGYNGSIATKAKNLNYCYFLDAMDNIEETATADGALFATVRQLTAAEMADKGSFETFDFETVWQMGDGHPVFRQSGY